MKEVWKPTEAYIKSLRLYQLMNSLGFSDYDSFHQYSIDNPADFWTHAEQALQIEWFKPYEQALQLKNGLAWPKWFVGGELNLTYNAVDKWAVQDSYRDQPALLWISEQGAEKAYTFRELKQEVEHYAAALIYEGIGKGDRVALYLPMIPETVITMLALSRIGAILTPLFTGFAADAIKRRLESFQPHYIFTSTFTLRKGKQIPLAAQLADSLISYRAELAFVQKVYNIPRSQTCSPELERVAADQAVTWADWQHCLKEIEEPQAPALAFPADTPFMVIYTSGTTSRPKGIVHTHAGFPLKAAFDAGITMDVCAGDRLCWITDMGWMMGPFLVYGALLNGATAVLFEGAPDYPEVDAMWQRVDQYQLTHLGLSPTFVRAIKAQRDPAKPLQASLQSLKLIGSTGEPWNEDPWLWLFDTIGKGNIPIYNYSGGTEISGGIFGNVLVKPIMPVGFNAALPGMAADIYDELARSCQRDEVGELVLKQPWVGMAHGFWQEKERYEQTYWSKWPETWVHGDWVYRNAQGYWFITGRSDDTLNIAGKRMGPADMESILVEHPAVKEAGTIGIPDPIKGETAICFVVLAKDQAGQHVDGQFVEWVEQRLGKALRPAAVHVVSDLPKTRNGKIMRRVLRAAYLGQDTGDLSALENPAIMEEIKQLRQRQ